MMQVLSDIQKMLAGKKTHLTAWGGFLVVLLGWATGGFDVGQVHVPAFTPGDVFQYLWATGVVSSLRAGIAKIQPVAIK